MEQLPDKRPLTVVQLPDGSHVYADPATLPAQQPAGPQVVHIHQAPPDRTVQRVALGSGVGAGAVAAGVYFGPLLVGALTAIAANLAMLAFIALVLGWAVVTVVRAVGDGGKGAGKRGGKGR
ncbi:hypothetical protein KEF29_31890 [Streptomyces tuirus]|uniref:Uncharacterized protein n=1 Tax=Streptomyces tuirus TaxID=68278 RepID=A0A941FGM4_9ACTN|nr:hypothetical protein [Streptomyces tuirus]